MFDQAVIEQLGYYVYVLKDPRTGDVFYVGKGLGNRIFQHVACALDSPTANEKLDRIRDICNSGHSVTHFVLRHGLTETSAFEVEAAAIDLLGFDNLTNAQGGHYSGNYGIQTVDEIAAMYEAEPFSPDGASVMLININKLYKRTMSAEELYYSTRKSWVVGPRREKATYAIPTFRGLTREVYRIHRWVRSPNDGPKRWMFEGVLAQEEIREKFRYRSIAKYFPPGAANPIKYFGC